MKRKTIVLLSSVLASVTLVGGAFAAFAVTDGADPFGINVTPGDLDVDDTTYVTLKWGETTGLTGVGNLSVGENRKAGIVSLQATPAYTGVFTLNIRDVTTAEKETTDAKLLDYLNVYVYDGNVDLVGEQKALPEGDPLATIVKATQKDTEGKKQLSVNVQGTPAGHELSVFVNFDSSANPVYTQLKNDKVFLQVDWSPKSGEEATGDVIYATKPSDWDKIYAYAWDGEKTNAVWPGVEMVHAYDDVYQILIPADTHANLIFNDNNGNQTDDLTFQGFNPNTAPYWNGTTWAAKPSPSIGLVMTATVDDEEISLINVKEPGDSENRAIYKVNLTAGQVIKFKDGNTDVHFYHYDTEEHDDGTSYTATVAGLHTFYYNKDSHMYVGLPEAEKVYYLVGIGDKWGIDDGIALTKVSDINYKAENVVMAAGENIKITDGTTAGWWGVAEPYENCGWTVGAGGNCVVTEAGTYTVNFWTNGENGNYITIAQQA